MISDKQILELASGLQVDPALFKGFLEVESSGRGFDKSTGKIIIQFEPHKFSEHLHARGIKHTLKKVGKQYVLTVSRKPTITLDKDPANGIVTNYKIVNGVEGQKAEWEAFNTAWKIDQESAMLATSIGLPQILGANHRMLGFQTVGEMWDFFKLGEYEQIEGLARFIKSYPRLHEALKTENYNLIATYYNGARYRELAASLGVEPYDSRIKKAHLKFKKDFKK
jgi:hypothetical protein